MVVHKDSIEAAAASIVFVERESYEKGFSQYFAKYLQQKLARIERKRLSMLSHFRWFSLLSIPLFLGIYAAIIFVTVHHSLNPSFAIIEIIGLTMLGFALHLFFKGRFQAYIIYVKKNILPDIFTFFGSFQYAVNGKIPRSVLKQSYLFEDWQRSSIEDHIIGVFEGLNVEIAEVTLERRTKDKTDKYIALQELVIIFYMGNRLAGRTLITSSPDVVNPRLQKEMPKVALSDPSVYAFSNLQGEATSLLNTEFLTAFNNLLARPEVHQLSCSFFDNKLIVKVANHQNLFEPRGIFSSALDTHDVRKFLGQIASVFDIIRIFASSRKDLEKILSKRF